MSVNTKMTAIADEIRTLSGTTGTMGLDAMAANVNDANTEVNSQTDLIGQIMTALETKTAPSQGVELPTLTNEGSASDLLEGKQLISSNGEVVTGTLNYEDVTDETNTYTSLLTDLETAIDALPDVESGGSGGSVKTCTVEVHVTRGGTANALLYGYSYTSFVDGAYSPTSAQGGGYPSSSAVSDAIFYNVVCGSLITLSIINVLTFWDISIDNANLLQCGSVGNSFCPQILIQAPSEPDSVGVINLDYTD